MELKNLGSIDESFYKLVSPENFRTPIAYFLAKTHKNDYDTNLKFRPIISSYNSYAFGLAKRMSDVLNISLIQNKRHFGFYYKIEKFKNYWKFQNVKFGY